VVCVWVCVCVCVCVHTEGVRRLVYAGGRNPSSSYSIVEIAWHCESKPSN